MGHERCPWTDRKICNYRTRRCQSRSFSTSACMAEQQATTDQRASCPGVVSGWPKKTYMCVVVGSDKGHVIRYPVWELVSSLETNIHPRVGHGQFVASSVDDAIRRLGRPLTRTTTRAWMVVPKESAKNTFSRLVPGFAVCLFSSPARMGASLLSCAGVRVLSQRGDLLHH